jgi:hypothetical protein
LAAAENIDDLQTIRFRDERRTVYTWIVMTDTWIQVMERMLTRRPGLVSGPGDYHVPGCSYAALFLDDDPEEIANERLTESTYRDITTQLEVTWGPPDFQGDGAGSGLRKWQDAVRLSYWKKRGDLAIVAIQAYDNTRHYGLTLSVLSAAEIARQQRETAQQMTERKALSDERERALQELIAQLTGPAPDPRSVQIVWAEWPER